MWGFMDLRVIDMLCRGFGDSWQEGSLIWRIRDIGVYEHEGS